MKNLLLSIFALGVMSLQANSSDSYTIKKVAVAPVIDGQVTEWQGIETMTYSVHNTGATGTSSGVAQAVWSDDAVYFAFSISDSDVRSTLTNQDDNLFNEDDLVEIFLDFDGDGKNYVELGISAADVNYDMTVCPTVTCGSWGSNGTWDISGLETAVTVVGTLNNAGDVDQGYFIEVKIPFSGLSNAPSANFSVPQIGSTWKGNVYTIDYSTAGADLSYLSWSNYTAFGFHQPNDFATFEFGGLATSVNTLASSNVFTMIEQNVWNIQMSGATTVLVYDLTGKIVSSKTVLQSGLVDLNGFNSGVYLVKLENAGEVETKKVMVK